MFKLPLYEVIYTTAPPGPEIFLKLDSVMVKLPPDTLILPYSPIVLAPIMFVKLDFEMLTEYEELINPPS